MFCSNCGNKINDGDKFCSSCGTKTINYALPEKQTASQSISTGLPKGMIRTPDGKIWWSFIEKKKEVMCYFDNESIALMHEVEPKKNKSAIGSLLLEAAELVAINSDNYPFIPVPSDLEGDEPTPTIKLNGKEYYHYPYKFRYISTMKEDRKHNIIKLFCYTWWTFHFTEEQYDFALNYLLAHCKKNIKRK